ncbi:MAG: ChrR family anti-sigma-E factor, partial [Pseudomonadota bacterium]
MTRETNVEFSELYSAYASGSLDAGFTLLVETQAALRQDIAVEVLLSEAIAGAFLEEQEPTELASCSLDKTFALIDRAETPLQAHRAAAAAGTKMLNEISVLPSPLLDHAVDAIAVNGWKSASAGVQCLTMDLGTKTEVELYRIEPNQAVPRHSHAGSEFTLVVAGGFTDETGSFGPGDLSVKGPKDTHQPVADAGEVCYALAVRDGDLKLTGVMGVFQ